MRTKTPNEEENADSKTKNHNKKLSDYSVPMKRKVEDMAVSDMSEHLMKIWKKSSEEMDRNHPAWCGLNNRQVTDLV